MNVSSHIVYNHQRVKTVSIFVSQAQVSKMMDIHKNRIQLKNKILTHARTWMKSRNTTSKGNQEQKATNNTLFIYVKSS